MSRSCVFTPALFLAVALLTIPACSPCRADQAADSADPAGMEEIEEIDEVEQVAGEPEADDLLQTLGRFHPVVLHFPIAWLLLLVLVEVVVLSRLAGELNGWSLALLILTVLSFIPAIISGLGMASRHASASGEFLERILLHRNFNISAGVVLLAALVVRVMIGRVKNNRLRVAYLMLLFAAAGLLGYGSHLGGEMVWGKGFLPFPF